jgi:hypothetical protein
MRCFKSVAQAQRFLAVHDVVATCSPLDDIGFAPDISDFCAARVRYVERRGSGLTTSASR